MDIDLDAMNQRFWVSQLEIADRESEIMMRPDDDPEKQKLLREQEYDRIVGERMRDKVYNP